MSGNDSRVFSTQPLHSETHSSDNDEKNQEDFFHQIRKQLKGETSSSQQSRGKQMAPKDMVRTDSRQQKLDMFINLSKSKIEEDGCPATKKVTRKLFTMAPLSNFSPMMWEIVDYC